MPIINDVDKAVMPQIRIRTNCECIYEISEEMHELDSKMRRLKRAIDADPEQVPVSAKALWKSQYKAMSDYKVALQARIIDLIELDKENK